MFMKRLAICMLVLSTLLLAVPVNAQEVRLDRDLVKAVNSGDPVKAIPFGPGVKLFIEKMDGGLDGFLVAEIMKKKVPVQIVLEKELADFLMTGSSNERKAAWHEGWLSPNKDRATGSIMVISRTNELVWAEEAGDRSLLWGTLARGGPRKVASRIASRLKDYLKKHPHGNSNK